MHVAHAHLDALCDAVDAVVNQLGVNSHEAIDGLVRRVDRAWGAAGQRRQSEVVVEQAVLPCADCGLF